MWIRTAEDELRCVETGATVTRLATWPDGTTSLVISYHGAAPNLLLDNHAASQLWAYLLPAWDAREQEAEGDEPR